MSVPNVKDYSHSIDNTTVDASVSKLFTTSPDRRYTRITNVRNRTTNRPITK